MPTINVKPQYGTIMFGLAADGSLQPVAVDAAGAVKQSAAPAALTCLGYGQITATSAVKGLADVPTINIPAGATLAIIEPEGADARYRDDGTNPSASVGMRLADGARLAYSGDLTALKFIAQSGTAIYNVSYYK